MTIIINSTEDKKAIYNMTRSRDRLSMKDAEEIAVKDYIVFEDVNKATGEVVQLASIMDNDGTIYTTNSPTFIDDFAAIADAFPDVEVIKVVKCKSKKNREFLVCNYVR